MLVRQGRVVYKLQKDSMLSCVCPVIEHKRLQNVAHEAIQPSVLLLFLLHSFGIFPQPRQNFLLRPCSFNLVKSLRNFQNVPLF